LVLVADHSNDSMLSLKDASWSLEVKIIGFGERGHGWCG